MSEARVGKSWEELGIDVKKSHGMEYTKCPACSDDRKKKRTKPLGVKHDENYAYCNHCSASFRVESDQEFVRSEEKKPREYTLPEWTNRTELSDKVVKYFTDDRKISQQTLIDLKITEGRDWMPQFQQEVPTIHFNYFRADTLVNVKYRGPKKSFKLHSNAELILYNLNSIKYGESAIIVEGEIGAATWHTASISCGRPELARVVSVPNGVPLSEEEKKFFMETGRFQNNKARALEYIDNSWEQIKHIQKWYIATDNDPPGLKLRQELIRRFGAEKCWIIDFGKFKDENELVQQVGYLELEKCFDAARQTPITGVRELKDDIDEVLHLYHHGFEKGMSTGLHVLDPHFTLRLGELTIVNGIPGHGKTSFVLHLFVFAATRYDWRFAIFCPENYPSARMWITLLEIYVGKSADKEKRNHMTEDELIEATDFVSDHFFLIDMEDGCTLTLVLDIIQQLVHRKGVNGCLIDPYNDLMDEPIVGGLNTEANILKRDLSRIRYFKRKNNLAFFINAHPIVIREKKKDSDTPIVPTAYHLAGGAMWYNRADNIITVYRNPEDDFGWTEIHVQKIKFQKITGIPTEPDSPVRLFYEIKSNRYHSNKPEPEKVDVPEQDFETAPSIHTFPGQQVWSLDESWKSDEEPPF